MSRNGSTENAMPHAGIWIRLLFSVLLVTGLGGCEAIGDIFKAGVWTGLIGVVVVIGLVVFIVSRFRG